MIIFTKNDRVTYSHFDSYFEESEFFVLTRDGMKRTSEVDKHSIFEERGQIATLRRFNPETESESIEVIAIVDDVPSMKRSWTHVDKQIPNRQNPDTFTEIKGWQLL